MELMNLAGLSGTFEVNVGFRKRSNTAAKHSQSGSPKWQSLTNKIFVGSQRLIRETGKPLIVEINLSEVVVNNARL